MTGCSKPSAAAPVFEQPWHAQVFAVTVALNEAGHFSWNEWTETFSRTLRQHGVDHQLNGGDDYFRAWLAALETLLAASGAAAPDDIDTLSDAWARSYRDTPHGDPVKLRWE